MRPPPPPPRGSDAAHRERGQIRPPRPSTWRRTGAGRVRRPCAGGPGVGSPPAPSPPSSRPAADPGALSPELAPGGGPCLEPRRPRSAADSPRRVEPAAPCPDGSYGPTFASSHFRDAVLPSESPSTQNGYLVWVFRWRSVLIPKSTMGNAFFGLGDAVGDSLSSIPVVVLL